MAITSAPGPGGISTSIYKEHADQLIYPIKKIWQTSLESGKLPKGAAQAIMTPIYKSAVKSNPANYHPVSLTNHLRKYLREY